MKKIILINILLLICVIVNAQSHDIIWQNSYGGTQLDRASSVCLTSDNGYVIGGGTLSNDGDVSGNHGGSDFWVIKLDALGVLQWQRCLGGSKDDKLECINSTSDGGFITCGYAISINGNVSGHHNSGWELDGWVVKLNSLGNIQWQKCLGGEDTDAMFYTEETFDGGYITGGITYSDDGDVTLNKGIRDCWVVKLDSLGNIQWQKTYGGSNYDLLNKIIQLADSSYIFTGYSNSSDGDVSNNYYGDDVWVVKLDAEGNMEWENSYGGSGTDHSSCIAQSINGGYTISALSFSDDGDVSGGHGNFDAWILEIDSLGNLIWQNCYGGSESDQAKWLSKTADGGNIITGVTGSYDGDVTGNHGGFDCWVIKTDSIGILEWQQCYGGSGYDHGKSVFQNPTGNHVVASWSASNDGDVSGNHGEIDFWVFEIESDTSLFTPIGEISNITGPDSICVGTFSETYSIDPILNATSYTWTLDPDIADSIVTNDTIATIYFEQGTSGYSTLSVFGSNNSGNSDTSYLYVDIIVQPISNAGSDTTICENGGIFLNGSATSYNYVYWNTLGDGIFDNPYLLNATYTLGNEDITVGNVDLIMFAFANNPCLGEVGDTINLSITQLPIVYAGEDDTICESTSYSLTGIADNFSSIMWSTSGDGVFDDSSQLITTYYPGFNDNSTGNVTLFLSLIQYIPVQIL